MFVQDCNQKMFLPFLSEEWVVCLLSVGKPDEDDESCSDTDVDSEISESEDVPLLNFVHVTCFVVCCCVKLAWHFV